MDRRQFLSVGAAGLLSAALPNSASAQEYDSSKKRRVGIIGPGWYGKCDLIRLIQVANVEVVSMCDVDSKMLGDAADIIEKRQESKKRPRTYSDYRKLLAEKDIDLVIIDTPDHWHALPMIEACQKGIDVWVQKPISVDVMEGEAMVAAARKYNRVVQVGMQRRSTPHLIEARDKYISTGKLGKIGLVEVYCYYHMRTRDNPPNSTPPANLDYEMWTGPAPLMPYNTLVHPRRWRAFMEYGNGIVGDMCVHMLDMTRWMLDLGWPKRISSSGGILIDKDSRANITDTQAATFEFDNLNVVWQHRSYGHAPDPKYPWGATFYGEKGTLKCSVMGYDFMPEKGPAEHRDVTYEYEQYPEDRTEKDLERHVAPAIRGHMKSFLGAIDKRSRPVADIEQGHISAASCILANMSQKLGRTLAYDPAKKIVTGDSEATTLLSRQYRAPWIHPNHKKV